ncbi:MAG: RNA polymerase subunit sigma-24 [Verrucomicrobiaceae bacterium]|nr:RNA polymerase subunit sigma-24 [Verrucomicrobiaceae bacterium]
MDDSSPAITPELLARVRSGDESANRTLVEILYPSVQANVRNHLRRQADHDDVAQEVFLKIFLKMEQYRGPQPFEHWVSRIAVTTCYDWLRKHRIRPLVTYSDLSEAEVEILEKSRQTSSRGTSDTQRELFSGLLDKLISTLNPREQIVIRLLDLEERSVRDISELTGWGASKVKVTAMRARRKLADRLRQLESSQAQGNEHC